MCSTAFRASDSAAKWYWLHYDETQGAPLCFICVLWYVYLCVYGYFLNTLHDLIYVATMYA